jgi:hypothetical protein
MVGAYTAPHFHKFRKADIQNRAGTLPGRYKHYANLSVRHFYPLFAFVFLTTTSLSSAPSNTVTGKCSSTSNAMAGASTSGGPSWQYDCSKGYIQLAFDHLYRI